MFKHTKPPHSEVFALRVQRFHEDFTFYFGIVML